MNAAKLLEGSWTARWGNWAVGLRSCPTGWDVIVWRWPPNTALTERVLIDQWDGFKTTDEAVSWACDVMVTDGAVVHVLGAPPTFALKRVLSFSPAAEAVA